MVIASTWPFSVGLEVGALLVLPVAQEHQRPQEVVPYEHEVEQRDDEQRRQGQRQNHMDEVPEMAASIDATRVVQFARKRQEELAQQEDAEGVSARMLRL
mgnify:CR=1 FL=1